AQLIACSLLRPPNTTATRILESLIATERNGQRPHGRPMRTIPRWSDVTADRVSAHRGWPRGRPPPSVRAWLRLGEIWGARMIHPHGVPDEQSGQSHGDATHEQHAAQ